MSGRVLEIAEYVLSNREFAGGVSPLRKRHVNFASRHFEWIRFSHGEELLCGWVP